MSGTILRDANAINILAGATLNAAGTTTSTAVFLGAFGTDMQFELTTGTVASTGNTATARIDVQVSDVAAFTTFSVLTSFFLSGTDAAQSNVTRKIAGVINRRGYIRANVVLGGTAPNYTGMAVTPRATYDRLTATSTA